MGKLIEFSLLEELGSEACGFLHTPGLCAYGAGRCTAIDAPHTPSALGMRGDCPLPQCSVRHPQARMTATVHGSPVQLHQAFCPK